MHANSPRLSGNLLLSHMVRQISRIKAMDWLSKTLLSCRLTWHPRFTQIKNILLFETLLAVSQKICYATISWQKLNKSFLCFQGRENDLMGGGGGTSLLVWRWCCGGIGKNLQIIDLRLASLILSQSRRCSIVLVHVFILTLCFFCFDFVSEWLVNQHRDSAASYIGHYNLLDYFALVENETRARTKFNLLEVSV